MMMRTKAVFFPIGKHATYYPDILKQVAAAGHTVGAHTWSHAHLTSKKLNEQQVKDEVEKGFSAVKFALGNDPAPFFRFPGAALPSLLRRLKAGGYKVVHMRAKMPLQTLVEYDKGMVVDARLPTVSNRAVGSVVQNVVN